MRFWYISHWQATKTVMSLCIQAVDRGFATSTVKPVIRGHSKLGKTKLLMKNGSLMKVESIAECSFGPLTCIKRYSVLKRSFGLFFEWPLKPGFTV